MGQVVTDGEGKESRPFTLTELAQLLRSGQVGAPNASERASTHTTYLWLHVLHSSAVVLSPGVWARLTSNAACWH